MHRVLEIPFARVKEVGPEMGSLLPFPFVSSSIDKYTHKPQLRTHHGGFLEEYCSAPEDVSHNCSIQWKVAAGLNDRMLCELLIKMTVGYWTILGCHISYQQKSVVYPATSEQCARQVLCLPFLVLSSSPVVVYITLCCILYV